MVEKDTIKSIIRPDNPSPSLFYWNSILNFFYIHKDELSVDEVKELCTECERCRIYWKTEQNYHIRREEVYPNIYNHIKTLETKT